jgi:hypothetical protein
MRKSVIPCAALLGLLACGAGASAQRLKATRLGVVCGDPTVRCRTSIEFQPYQLPFRIPPNAVIWESEHFYAVVLKSVRDESRGGNCDIFVPEADREAAQALFPRHKVFASRCMEPGDLYYTGVSDGAQFMAVYAGRTRAEGQAMLSKVKATGQFPGANLRRMQTGFNGT